MDSNSLSVSTTDKNTSDVGIDFEIVQARFTSGLVKIPWVELGRERRTPGPIRRWISWEELNVSHEKTLFMSVPAPLLLLGNYTSQLT